jgi:L,D-peptidoglycan transpeptidase YkuD (ErfK/YbiS/YcfS/YnhG family)
MLMRTGRGGGFGIVVAALLAAGCARQGQPPTSPAPGLPVDAEQVVVVRPIPGALSRVGVSAWERDEGRWAPRWTDLPGVIGRGGFAPAGQKREGDGRTPSGVFRLERAFGYDADLVTGLTYRQATTNDSWVDDPQSPNYNRWVTGRPRSGSFEQMRRDDDLYRVGAVIEYNTESILPGFGSAIFLHVWAGPDRPTAGCVALAEPDVRRLLRWLDRRCRPVIALGSP